MNVTAGNVGSTEYYRHREPVQHLWHSRICFSNNILCGSVMAKTHVRRAIGPDFCHPFDTNLLSALKHFAVGAEGRLAV